MLGFPCVSCFSCPHPLLTQGLKTLCRFQQLPHFLRGKMSTFLQSSWTAMPCLEMRVEARGSFNISTVALIGEKMLTILLITSVTAEFCIQQEKPLISRLGIVALEVKKKNVKKVRLFIHIFLPILVAQNPFYGTILQRYCLLQTQT